MDLPGCTHEVHKPPGMHCKPCGYNGKLLTLEGYLPALVPPPQTGTHSAWAHLLMPTLTFFDGHVLKLHSFHPHFFLNSISFHLSGDKPDGSWTTLGLTGV